MSIFSRMAAKVLNIHPDERAAFGRTGGLVFLIMFSQILFGNFTDTAFIKRFGVEYLPEMFLIDAVSVFFVMDSLRGLVGRYAATALLTRIFVISAFIEVLCRILILFDLSLLYPIMYILRLQFDGVMLVVFWNICNDIFDTRQSKRLFSLITAGGILGRILGSFSTTFLSGMLRLDNLILVSAGLLLVAAFTSHRIGQRFPSPIAVLGARGVKKQGWSSPIAGMKEMTVLAKGSLLFVLLAAIRILPNVVGPMFDFQFSVILDENFASEAGLIQFYGTFRGVMSIITFVVLMFIGAVYTRVGIPNALLFRPGNYFLVFSLLLFRFDLLIGIYGRLSISVLTMTMHNPANNIMVNLFPDQFRAKVRPILQVVSRAGSLAGSLILLGLKSLIHASYFSILGLFFVSLWILVTFRLKKKYSTFLLETILEKQVDLQELEDIDLGVLIQDPETLDRLLEGLRVETGGVATLCARILSEARYPDLSKAILSVIREKDLPLQVELLDLLGPEDGRDVVPTLLEMAENASPDLRAHLVRTVGRLAPGEHIDFLKRACEVDEKAVQAEAIVGLYRTGMESEGYPLLSAWLESPDSQEILLGLATVARTGESRLKPRVYEILEGEKDPRIQAKALEALGTIQEEGGGEQILAWLESPSPEVRRAAVLALSLDNERTVERTIDLLGDESSEVREATFEKLSQMEKRAVPFLLKSLNSPKRDVKGGILRLLERLEVKEAAFSEFIAGEIRSAYENLYAIEQLKTLRETPAVALLIQHLEDKKNDALFTIFRILEVQGEGRRIRTIYRGLGGQARERANAVEALESMLHPTLAKVLVPLVEEISPQEKLKVAQREFNIAREENPSPSAILGTLLSGNDPVTKMCALYVIQAGRMEGFTDTIQSFLNHPEPAVRETAQRTLEKLHTANQKGRGKSMLSTMDKMIHLKKIYIFSDLQVRELAAVSSVTTEQDYPKGEIVVKEGEPGDTMFLIVSGEVSVIRNHGSDQETLIAKIKEEDYFGEMALFEDKPRSATVKTDTDAKLLLLGKLEFEEIMKEFPQIAINICRVFSQRIRDLQEKFLS